MNISLKDFYCHSVWPVCRRADSCSVARATGEVIRLRLRCKYGIKNNVVFGGGASDVVLPWFNNGRRLKLLLFPKCSFVIYFEGWQGDNSGKIKLAKRGRSFEELFPIIQLVRNVGQEPWRTDSGDPGKPDAFFHTSCVQYKQDRVGVRLEDRIVRVKGNELKPD